MHALAAILVLLILCCLGFIVQDVVRNWRRQDVEIVDFGHCGHRGWLPQAEVLKLQARVSEQRRQLTQMQGDLRARNLQLDAMHWVWCDGGCKGGVHRWGGCELTEEIVVAAERNAARLRRWYETQQTRKAWAAATKD